MNRKNISTVEQNRRTLQSLMARGKIFFSTDRAQAFIPICRPSKRPAAAIAALEQMGLTDVALENRLEVRNDGDTAEIEMIGAVGSSYWDEGGITEKEFRNALKTIPRGKPITLLINSEGGSVKEGLGIYNAIQSRAGDITARISGYALSIASVFPLAAGKVVSPKSAIWMIHKAWSWAQGNADDMEQAATQLKTHDATLVDIYHQHTGKSKADLEAAMKAETWIKGGDAVEYGLADEGDDEEVDDAFAEYRPLHPDYVARCKNISPAILNCIAGSGGAKTTNPQPKENIVNRNQKIALLNSWGVKVEASVTDTELDNLIANGKPKASAITREQNTALLNAWGVKFAANATDIDIENLVAAGKPKAGAQNDGEKVIIVDFENTPTVKALKKQLDDTRRASLRTTIERYASEDRIPVNQIADWVEDAFNATDDPTKGNPILARLAQFEPRTPGNAPINIELGTEKLGIEKLNKTVLDLGAPLKDQHRNARSYSKTRAEIIGLHSKQMNRLIKMHAKYEATAEHPHGMLVGPLRDAWDNWAAGFGGGVQNANTISPDLQRQMISAEIMRAFKRAFQSLSIFSKKFENVPLEGNDFVKVPYYPLDTVASTEFIQANGYNGGQATSTLSKSILVGGIGNNVASAGSGRKFKQLQFNAYEFARQPWLNVAQLCALAAEQLAIDVRADIMGTQINAANFGNKIWSGASGAFDHTVVTQYLQNAAIKAFWPQGSGAVVLNPDFYTSLCADPAVSEFLKANSDQTLRKGIIGALYGFKSVEYDALMPIANFIRGGDGAVTAGTDLNLAGFMAYPSAVLIATAPIMPTPGVMKKLLMYELMTEDESDLTLSYRYWGDEKLDLDNNIIELTYGSGLGEVQALKRIVTAGN